MTQDILDNEVDEMIFRPPTNYENLIEDFKVDEFNPYNWTVDITHEPPQRLPGITDEMYSFFLREKSLYIRIKIVVYRNKNFNTLDPLSKQWFIHINRLSGRSPVQYHYINSIIDMIDSKEKKYNEIFKPRYPILALNEGITYASNNNILRYLLDFGIIREVCAFIS
jgi:hypothetical protein